MKKALGYSLLIATIAAELAVCWLVGPLTVFLSILGTIALAGIVLLIATLIAD